MRFSSFIGGSGVSQSVIADAEDTINLYVERLGRDAESPRALFPTPGFSQWSQTAYVGTRGAIVAKGRLFKVIGGQLCEFDTNGVVTYRGAVGIDANPAQLIYNGQLGDQLGIASGGNIYSYNLTTNTLALQLTGEGTMIAYAAGFGLAFNINTGKVRLSKLNDLTTWPADTFFQRSLFADPYQAMFVDTNNLVWLIGTDTFEVRYNSGVGTQPFVPLSGLVGRYGIAAPFAFGLSGAGNMWLAKNPEGIGEFVTTRGGMPQPVNSYAFSTSFATYLRTAKIDNAEVVTYQAEGHTFATISFPSVPASHTYDATTDSWARRGQWNAMLGRFDLWAPRTHVYYSGKHLVGDRTTSKVFEMDTRFTTEIDGSGMVRERTTPGLINEHKRVPIDSLELLMDVGLGTASGQGSDPQAILRVSDDGGRTFGNELRAGIGRMGEFRRRVLWNRLGAKAHTVLRVRFSDPAPSRIVDAFVNGAEQVAA